ncbi:hypothetical protein JL09_g7071 [Pichia kudriavzevii]|uniref:Uncharacterized protein n=1 Tax=Pichia kudriavzevii TaxID=4909 RepID=A0A099NK52_PICKU|nr:hypothetical protein JL09_g7071 [Pichia kudriavzevii]
MCLDVSRYVSRCVLGMVVP